jgi:carboxylesterase type B
MQAPYPAGSLYRLPPEPLSEDCLSLNVWTAANSPGERRPVMVWVHGGGLTRGSGSARNYDGEELARKGVVLVTINSGTSLDSALENRSCSALAWRAVGE